MTPRYSQEWLDYFIPETIEWNADDMPDLSRAVLKNLLLRSEKWPHGIPDAEVVHRVEGAVSYSRMQELADRPLPGRYDLDHFQRIHYQLFQDVYPWAGQLRTAPQDWPMVKWGPDVAAVRNGQNHVTEIPHKYFKAREVPQAATVVLDRIAAKDNLRGLARNDFIGELATVWLRINFVHPFREGNTRAQFAFFRQLSAEAGYRLDTDRFHAVSKTELKQNPLVGDLREQFVWGRFEYMQTGDTRLMRDVLDHGDHRHRSAAGRPDHRPRRRSACHRRRHVRTPPHRPCVPPHYYSGGHRTTAGAVRRLPLRNGTRPMR
ncbi:Fic family protein (plasmid) [Rhodococcus pyridinivorans]|uniref:Fic/DOC family protein n=1 Tax=Rhodococcus pyridinivorans TaxID=103816 RepID=UPI0020C68720|nr:Fic family protein [Rhodococcus pyridinivorans]UTM39698.1 Fic family protein [Rhodococcus pyridinivorans]